MHVYTIYIPTYNTKMGCQSLNNMASQASLVAKTVLYLVGYEGPECRIPFRKAARARWQELRLEKLIVHCVVAYTIVAGRALWT